MPKNIEDYVHRIGRTGRANTTGTSLTFFTSDNAKLARELVGVLREAGQPVEPALETLALRPFYGTGRGRGSSGGGGRGMGRGMSRGRSFGTRPNENFLTGANVGWSGPQY